MVSEKLYFEKMENLGKLRLVAIDRAGNFTWSTNPLGHFQAQKARFPEINTKNVLISERIGLIHSFTFLDSFIHSRSLGCSEDNSEIRRHRLFRHLDWEKLELLQIEPPFVPTIACNKDTSNFNTKYTRLDPVLDRISDDRKLDFIQLLHGFYYEKPEEIDEQAINSQ